MTTLNLPPMRGDADPVIIPGLRKALDLDVDPDFRASVDGGFYEDYAAFDARLTAAAQEPAIDTAVRAAIARLTRRITSLEQQLADAKAEKTALEGS
ncbi:hypothetical protein AB0D47_19955 [Streptomyces sp. NPDC048376]|uniref:hypothetical protein n=1 Tax=Streptomyces sp. NPDC048376 TaxID=3154926 RepID=UPI00343F7B27